MTKAMTSKKVIAWGESVDGTITYPCHYHQTRVLKSESRFTAAIAGTGGGKTVIGPLWVMRKIKKILRLVDKGERDLTSNPILGLVVAPTHPIMERATAPTFVNMFIGTDLEGTWIPSRNKYILPHGMGVIYFLSADNPFSLEGGQFDFAWVDEGGQLKFDAWIALQGRLGVKQAPALITTTPYGMNWLFKKFFKPWRAGDKNYAVFQWRSKDNPAYPKEEYERAKGAMSKTRGAQRYDGQFVRMEGIVYEEFGRAIVDPFRINDIDGTRYGGLDWGWTNPFAGLVGVLDSDDVLWVGYERYKRRTRISHHASSLPKDATYWADPSRPDYIKELRASGIRCLPANNDIMVGIDAVSSRILTDRLRISRDLKAVIAESDEYHFPEKEDEITGEKPVDEFNHALDALRYMIMGIDRRRVAKKDEERESERDNHQLETEDDGDELREAA